MPRTILIHAPDGEWIGYPGVWPAEGPVPDDGIANSYAVANEYVYLTDKDFALAEAESGVPRAVELGLGRPRR